MMVDATDTPDAASGEKAESPSSLVAAVVVAVAVVLVMFVFLVSAIKRSVARRRADELFPAILSDRQESIDRLLV